MFRMAIFFGHNPTGLSDDEGEDRALPCHYPTPPGPMHAEMVEAEVGAVKGPKPKLRKVKGMAEAQATRTRNPCKGSVRVPRYRFLCSGIGAGFFFFTFFLFRSCKLALLYPPYHGHCIIVRVVFFPSQQ